MSRCRLAQEAARRILVDLDVPLGSITLPEHMSSSAFRIAQESLTNVARHARASRVTIRLAIERLLDVSMPAGRIG